jgi:type III pantothenate kinase
LNLTLDIGNSRTKIALFNGRELVKKAVVDNPLMATRLLAEFGERAFNCKTIVSATSELDEGLYKMLRKNNNCLRLSAQTPLPISNQYKTPETLGKDRLAAVVGAWQLCPKADCLVVDAGTCITYELLTAEGAYLGGNIAPGLAMRLRAMHAFTAKLPLVERQRLDTEIGYSTDSALRTGGLLGAAMEISGFMGLYQKKWPKLQLVLTGGDAPFLAELLQDQQAVVSLDLVSIGLNEILLYNNNAEQQP